MTTYTDEQRAEFLERASEIGITRAMRQLGYPASWVTGKSWMESAGIEAPLDELKAQAAAHHDWYQTEDLLLVGQEGIKRVVEALQNTNLSPDEQKKLSEAYQKYANTWLLLQGKANAISETRHKDNSDIALMELLNEEAARNANLDKEAKSYQDLEPVRV
jgi:hypothetical protein